MMIFLSNHIEADRLCKFEPRASETLSSTSRVFAPIWGRIADLVPSQVSPNVLSLASLLSIGQAYYISALRMECHPQAVTFLTTLLTLVFWTLDEVDVIHARRTGNFSALTHVFDHICSTLGTILLILSLCNVFGVDSMQTRWCLVQGSMLLLLHKHIQGLVEGVITCRPSAAGPSDFFFATLVMLVAKMLLTTVVDLDAAIGWAARGFGEAAEGLQLVQYDICSNFSAAELLMWSLATAFTGGTANGAGDGDLTTATKSECTWWPDSDGPKKNQHSSTPGAAAAAAALLFCLVQAGLVVVRLFWTRHQRPDQSWTTNGLLICLAYRAIPNGQMLAATPFSQSDVAVAGLSLAMLTTDVLVARLSGRQLHAFMPLVMMVSLISNTATAVLCTGYYGFLLFEIMQHLRLPLLSTVVNVYCDGVYDLCHVGHMQAYKKALGYGSRLIVGVCDDASVEAYKRRPIMTMEERVRIVSACKHVHSVIPNAPCKRGSLDEAFIKKHNIHIVCCGEEYDQPGDEWYAVPRRMGILRTTSRYQEISTSDLVARIKARIERGDL